MSQSHNKIDIIGHNNIIIDFYGVITDTSGLCSKSYDILDSVIADLDKAKNKGEFDDKDKLLEIQQYCLNLTAYFETINERNNNSKTSIVILEQDISSEIYITQNTMKGFSGGIMQLTNRTKYGKTKLLLNDLERLFQHMNFLLIELDRISASVRSITGDIKEYTQLTEKSLQFSSSSKDRVRVIADKMLLGTRTLQHHLKHFETGANKTALQFRHNFFHILLA